MTITAAELLCQLDAMDAEALAKDPAFYETLKSIKTALSDETLANLVAYANKRLQQNVLSFGIHLGLCLGQARAMKALAQ